MVPPLILPACHHSRKKVKISPKRLRILYIQTDFPFIQMCFLKFFHQRPNIVLPFKSKNTSVIFCTCSVLPITLCE
ncbi:hypothetical protein CW304_02915 [Bacillus sp. UFRGS-B20]|nr:hypothetical protein CW304_02915 [Bacillus sp. UFRGS-B20]